MEPTADRRRFLSKGTVATAGLLTAGSWQISQAQEHDSHQHHTSEHETERNGEFPRTQAGPGGPVGSATDRGKLVSGYRSAADPPVSVEMPDLGKLPWKMVAGVKEFHLTAQHVRREVLPDQWFDF